MDLFNDPDFPWNFEIFSRKFDGIPWNSMQHDKFDWLVIDFDIITPVLDILA